MITNNENNNKFDSKIRKSDISKNSSLNDDISYSEINNPIMVNLLEFGYNYKLLKKLISYLNPQTVEQAIQYLSEENGIIQHVFIEDSKLKNKCTICQKPREQHLIENNIFNNKEINDIYSNRSIDTNSIHFNELENQENSKNIYNEEENNNNYKSKLNSKNIEPIPEMEGKTNSICSICEEEYFKSILTELEKCLHSFCKECWLNYIKISITEKKQIKIKCMDYSCDTILPEKFIFNIIKNNTNLKVQFKENKLREEILNNPKKKFCPFPNCNSYGKRNNKKERNVKCGKGHKFCFNCLQKPHKGECSQNLDEKMEKFAKTKFIKKCPNCGSWTEKNEGCNHITCIECNFQWCWLCNQKYTSDHYKKGKCKGYQFFKPKNEKDIQLAFEGKIQLREDERMYDINYDDFQIVRTFEIWKKIGIYFLFLLAGFIITIICQSGKYLSKIDMSRKPYHYFVAIYFVLVILFGFTIFFVQIFMNFIISTSIILKVSLIDFLDKFYSELQKIKNWNVFNNYDSIIKERFLTYTISIISLFFGTPIWIVRYIGIWEYIFTHKRISKQIFSICYIYYVFIINFIFFHLSFVLNIIGILEEMDRSGTGALKRHIEYLIHY